MEKQYLYFDELLLDLSYNKQANSSSVHWWQRCRLSWEKDRRSWGSNGID